MAKLRIEYVRLGHDGQVLELLGEGETLDVSDVSAQSSAAPDFGAAAGQMVRFGGRLTALDQAVIVATGADPTASANAGVRVAPGAPAFVELGAGAKVAAIVAADGQAGGVIAGAPLPASLTATIANGGSLTDAIDLDNTRLSRIGMPAGWTAANLTFQVSDDGDIYRNLYDAAGTEVQVTVAESRSVSLHSLYALFQDVRWLKIRSGTSAVAVNQGAERSLKLAVRAI